ncbi:RluA family pseudouridine synthase [Halalkalibacterium halodurans]|uniref:RluA family pseudouridine synthase n=1 Tax=Halalkalibacterium halodurans TaxID=86665 RepID=UPI002E1EA089|nr:RluA family pseudouridine synthase [Halalkalibacterium halodurans]
MIRKAKVEWTVDEQWDGELLRTFLREGKHVSKRSLAAIKFKGGTILLNGEEVTVRETVHVNDQVTLELPHEYPSPSMIAEPVPFDVIYENDHYLVVNKPAGVPTIPSRDHPQGTLANGLLNYFQRQKMAATFHAVNRLDKDTSGLLIVAKHQLAHDQLSKQQRQGNIKRTYMAIVQGEIEQQEGTITAPIARKEESLITREVREDGQLAITHFKVIDRLNQGTIVQVQLETGRTHQIRVHFSYLGYPLFGDDLYGGERKGIERQALHSTELTIHCPFTEVEQTFTEGLPPDMKELIRHLKA